MTGDLTPVLLLAYYFPPDTASGAARPHRFFKFLPEFGYQPHVITACEAAAGSSPFIHVAPARTRAATRKTLLGCTELALRKTFFVPDQAVLWTLSVRSTIRQVMDQSRSRAVFSTFPPVNAHIAARWTAHKYRIPWIADYRDPIVGNAFRPLTGLSGWTDRRLEHRYVREADASISVTDVAMEHWKKKFPEQASKMHLIWNGFDPEEDIEADAKVSTKPFILAHVGVFYGDRSPGPILSSVRRLIEAGRLDPKDLNIRLIGIIDPVILNEHTALLDWLRERGLLYLSGKSVPRDEARLEGRQADYLLLVDIAGDKSYAVPAKIFEYIRIGRPILAYTDEGSPVDRILASAGIPCRAVYRGESAERIDTKVAEFFTLPPKPTQPSEWFLEQFDGRRQTAALAKLFDSVIANKSRS